MNLLLQTRSFLTLLSLLLLASQPILHSQTAESLRHWHQKFTQILDDEALPFWTSPRLRDPEHGGFLVHLDENLQPTGDTAKHLMVHLRMLMNYAVAIERESSTTRQNELKRELSRQLDFLESAFWDPENGGWFWNADRAGKPTDPDRQMMVGQVYAIYALAEIRLRTGSERALALAEKTFAHIDPSGHDPHFGGYFQDYRKPPEDPVNLRKNASTNLHMLLALARLVEAAPKPIYRDRLSELYGILPRFVHSDSGNAYWALTRDWQTIPVPEGINNRTMYGHNAELLWYLHTAAIALGHDEQTLVPLSRKIADALLRCGISSDGAVYFLGPISGPSDDRQILWWAQAEAMIALLRVYRLTNDPVYWNVFEKVAEWTFAHAIPKDEPAAWWGVLDEKGSVTHGYRGGTNWKSGFHVIRALLEIERDLLLLQNEKPALPIANP